MQYKRSPDVVDRGINGDLEPVEAVILRSMNEGVITLECDGTIGHVNQAVGTILGYEPAELADRSFEDVFDDAPENRHFKEIVRDVIEKGAHTARSETRFKRGDGQIVDLSVATTYMDVDACEPGMENTVVVFRDITAFKAMERARKKAVDHLSHELKTPLSIIAASLDMAARPNISDEAREKTVTRIRRHLRRLTDIQEIVERIVTPRQYRPVTLTLDKEIEAILDRIRKESAHRDVRITPTLAPLESQSIDPEALAEIVTTLVKNAVEAVPDEGAVNVTLRRAPEGIELSVEDRGIGIPLQDLEFVFDGFHHTQETDEYSTRKPYDFNAGGKGLELLRLKALADEGHFHISFESSRCAHIPTARDHCPGRISECGYISDAQGCKASGGTVFTILFPDNVGDAE